MFPKRSRSISVTCALAAFMVVVLPGSRPRAQTAPPRPNVSIDRYPALTDSLWPADVNRDGRTDLVAGRGADLVVLLGTGSGTFAPARVVAPSLRPLTVGDFNGDTRLDIAAYARHTDGTSNLFVLGGNGDGTFQAPRPVA